VIRRVIGIGLSTALAFAPAIAAAAPAPAVNKNVTADVEVAKGIKLVEDGDYDTAILALDAAARRLAADPAKLADLSQAYLYLGIAYVGKGQEAAAKARFRDALKGSKDLTLSPSQFPPKVINLFEAARTEAAAAPEKGGGSTKWLLIGGGAAAAAGGVVLATGGGGGGSSSDGRVTETFTGSLCGGQQARSGGCDAFRNFAIVVGKPGTLEATLSWNDGSVVYMMILQDQSYTNVAASVRTSNTSSTLTANVTPQTACPTCAYQFTVAREELGGVVPFTLTVRHP
jgi:tetratricopeptide (TPR) repeat protein